MKKFVIAAVICSLVSAWCQGAIVYDWKTDWSGTGTQPDNGAWYYKGCVWNETAPSTYVAMSWDTNHWYYNDPGWWYFIRNGSMDHHQNAWDILAWKAPLSGTASLVMSGSTGGWGNCNVYLQVLDKNGNILDDKTITPGGNFNVSLNNIAITPGDYLYIRAKSASSYMWTGFDSLTITAIPEPAALTLLALGGVLAVARPRRRN